MTTVQPGDAAATFASQGDWARVVPKARKALALDPDDAVMHALLALGLANLNQSREAVEAGHRAVALDPDLALSHRALGWALLEDGDAAGAERAARETLRLDPDSSAYALLGQVLVRQRRWRDVLDAAASGLAIDPDDTDCTNLRALALGSLGRTEDAERAVEEALARDPDAAYSHTNRGWLRLRQARPDEALESFRTALRIDPTFEWARNGIIEALKARSGLYRIVLRYSLWMSTLDGRTRWLIIIGLLVAWNVGRGLLRANPTWLPVLGPLLVVYLLFVLGTWVAHPVSNLLLRLNPFGRLALTNAETQAAHLVGACLATAAASLVLLIVTSSSGWVALLGVSVLMLLPINAMFAGHGTRAWPALRAMLIVLACLGAAIVVQSFLGLAVSLWLLVPLIGGAILSGWGANYLSIRYG